MPTNTKTRRGRESGKSAEIRVRLNAKTKSRAEKFFKRYGITTSDGVRMFINNALKEKMLPFDPGTPHIPNAESLKAIEESLAGGGEIVTLTDLRKQWDEA